MMDSGSAQIWRVVAVGCSFLGGGLGLGGGNFGHGAAHVWAWRVMGPRGQIGVGLMHGWVVRGFPVGDVPMWAEGG